jgi:arginine decarboxylase
MTSLDQNQAPLLTALQTWADRDYAAFHTPGHKRGQGASDLFRQLLGHSALRADLPELPELDNLFAPQGVIQQAQDLAAEAFGADRTWFLANGSTAGVIAAILATCQPGDAIALPRNVHQSVISGLILAGANPVFIMPEYDPDWDIAQGVTTTAVTQTLAQNPTVKAVLIVSPNYYGVGCDITTIADATHRHNIPLIVDEAHGAHFTFHSDLPRSALASGADIAIQSTHKTLSALTQASMLHLQGDRVSAERIARSIALIQSTSPNYLLLASLDAARHQMTTIGNALLTQTLAVVKSTRQALSEINSIRLLAHYEYFDLTRLTIDVSGLGITGFTADAILAEEFNVMCELPSLRHLTFIFSIGTTAHDADRLIQAITKLAQQSHPHESLLQAQFSKSPEIVISPRDAFFADMQTVETSQAIDKISGELICPYPPGIPVLLPGERITQGAIDQLQTVRQSGGFISGCADPELKTIQIIIEA